MGSYSAVTRRGGGGGRGRGGGGRRGGVGGGGVGGGGVGGEGGGDGAWRIHTFAPLWIGRMVAAWVLAEPSPP